MISLKTSNNFAHCNIYNLFAKEEITVNTEWDGKIIYFSRKFQAWKKVNTQEQREQQLKEIIAQKDREIEKLKARLEELQLQAKTQIPPK